MMSYPVRLGTWDGASLGEEGFQLLGLAVLPLSADFDVLLFSIAATSTSSRDLVEAL